MADMAKLARKCWLILQEELGVSKTGDIPHSWDGFILHFLQAHLNDSRTLRKQEEEFRAAVKRRRENQKNE